MVDLVGARTPGAVAPDAEITTHHLEAEPAADELDLEVGTLAVASVKATNVVVELADHRLLLLARAVRLLALAGLAASLARPHVETLVANERATVILVTHNLREALGLSGRGRQLRVARIVIGHFSMHQSELRVTVEAVDRMSEQTARNILSVLDGDPVRGLEVLAQPAVVVPNT